MKKTLAETVDLLSKIIRLQTDIIDRLSIELLQHGEIEDAELELIQKAAMMQDEMRFENEG